MSLEYYSDSINNCIILMAGKAKGVGVGKIILNGQSIGISEYPTSLLELVALIEKEHIEEGWIVVELQVDGKAITDFTQPDGTLIAYAPEQRVEIATSKTSEIAGSLLGRFENYITKLLPGIEEVVRLYRSGENEEANRLYAIIIEGITTMIDLVKVTRNVLRVEEDALSPGEKSIEDYLSDMRDTVDELLAAQTDGDYERMADAMEFELLDNMKSWGEVIGHLKRLAEKQ